VSPSTVRAGSFSPPSTARPTPISKLTEFPVSGNVPFKPAREPRKHSVSHKREMKSEASLHTSYDATLRSAGSTRSLKTISNRPATKRVREIS